MVEVEEEDVVEVMEVETENFSSRHFVGVVLASRRLHCPVGLRLDEKSGP